MKDQLLKILSKNRLFEKLDIFSINMEGVSGRLVKLSEGEFLYQEGDEAESLYLIVYGEINLIKEKLLGESKTISYEDNTFLGEEELLEKTSRTSKAVALKDSYLIALSRAELELINNRSDYKLFASASSANEKESIVESQEKDKFFAGTDDDDNRNDQIDRELSDVVEPDLIDTESDDELSPSGSEHEEIENDDLISRDLPEVIELSLDDLTGSDELSPSGNEYGEIKNDDLTSRELYDTPEIEKVDNEPIDILSSSGTDNKELELNIFEEEYPLSPVTDENKDARSPTDQNEITNDSSNEFQSLEAGLTEFFVDPEVSVKKTEENINETNDRDLGENFKELSIIQEEPSPQSTDKLEQKILETNNQSVAQSLDLINLKTLGKISAAIQKINLNFDIESLLDNTVIASTDITESEKGILYLVDSDRNEMWGRAIVENDIRELRLKLYEDIPGWVARTGEVVNIANPLQDDRYNALSDKIGSHQVTSLLSLPLINSDKEIVAVLQLYNSSKGGFSEADVEKLKIIFPHILSAISNINKIKILRKKVRTESFEKMIHFLNNRIKKPLLVSRRYIEHLNGKELPLSANNVLGMIVEQMDEISDIIDSLNVFTLSKSALKLNNININGILQKFIQQTESFVQTKSVHFLKEFGSDVWVSLSTKEFYNVLNQIVYNACDTMPDGGNILIKTEVINDTVLITLQDSGQGIPPHILSEVYDPFYAYGKNDSPGLGLALAEKIIKNHDGTLTINNASPEGTSIVITLPVIKRI